jgi:Flp pilus assembly protein TadB
MRVTYTRAGDKMDTTTRWLSMLGIGTLCFGISLFVLRIPIRTIIVFFIIGVPLVAPWLYVDAKSKQQKKINTDTSVTTHVCMYMFNMQT